MAETIIKRRIQEESKDPDEEVEVTYDPAEHVVLEKFEHS